MKIIKRVMICCVCCLLAACHGGTGSFAKNDIDITALIEKINQKSIDGDWKFPILNHDVWTSNQVQAAYPMNMTKLTAYYVASSILPAQLGEIAFFQLDKTNDATIEKAVTDHLQTLQQQWGTVLFEAKNIIRNAEAGRIGEYYYVIIGSDAQKVVNYIRSYE